MSKALKYLLSFLKRDWQLSDYPIEVREQPVRPIPPGLDKERVGKPVRWIVRIPDWVRMMGVGDTKEEAWADLQSKFAEYKAEGLTLPRPGTKVPIQFAPREQIEEHEAIADEFFRKVLGMNYGNVFITDASSLWDFPFAEPKVLEAKIEEIYGIDMSRIDDGNLAGIFGAIEAKRAEEIG